MEGSELEHESSLLQLFGVPCPMKLPGEFCLFPPTFPPDDEGIDRNDDTTLSLLLFLELVVPILSCRNFEEEEVNDLEVPLLFMPVEVVDEGVSCKNSNCCCC